MDVTGRELTTVGTGPAREAWVSILELADEPGPLRRYLQAGELYGMRAADGAPVAAILVIDESPGVAELRNVAVAEQLQGQGIGTRLVNATLFVLAQKGIRRAVVGTASSGVRQLAFYQRLGFRLSHVERDYFSAARGYPGDLSENGIPSRDMVWMDRELPVPSLGV
jgi:ribosomal protein S18 acetylase RimI-like enzyme